MFRSSSTSATAHRGAVAAFALFFAVGEWVSAVGFLSISGNPATLMIQSATAGSQPNSANDQSTTYALTVSIGSTRITGQLNTTLPSGMSLAVALAAPTGATSLGSVVLSTTAKNLVTNLPIISSLSSGYQISYTLTADVSVAPRTAQNITVTFTIL